MGKMHTIYVADERVWKASQKAAKACRLSHSAWIAQAMRAALDLPPEREGITTTIGPGGIKHTWIE